MKNLRTVVVRDNSLYFSAESLGSDGFDKVPIHATLVRILDCIKHTTDHDGNVPWTAVTSNCLHQQLTEAVWTMWFNNDRSYIVCCEHLAALINSVCLVDLVRLTQGSNIELAHTCIVFDDQQRSGAWRHGHTFVMIVCYHTA
jgi:hypothetical protein